MLKWVYRASVAVLMVALLTVTVLFVRTDSGALTRVEITKFVTQLNEAAAIGVPHDFLMRTEQRVENLALLQKVEAGHELSIVESQQYRALFQSVLQESQVFLSRFDGELTILHDHAMEAPNNLSANGIPGDHDHHDESARRNFKLVLEELEALKFATTPFPRIRFANAVQKDLVDLISHIGVAPHTVAVSYSAPDTPWADAGLGDAFERYLKATKRAQFTPVNSSAYWSAIDQSLDAYTDLILQVQDSVLAATAPWERRIAGRFMSMQTLAPPVNLERPLRRN